MTTPSEPPKEGGRKRLTALIGTVAAIVGIIGGTIGIVKACKPQGPQGPAAFTADLGQQANVDNLVSFAKSNDGKVVRLEVTCRSDSPFCNGNIKPDRPEEAALLPVSASVGKYWFHIYTKDSDATANNGSYGAGSLVVKGYFTVNVQGVLGAEPQDVQNIELHGVSPASVKT